MCIFVVPNAVVLTVMMTMMMTVMMTVMACNMTVRITVTPTVIVHADNHKILLLSGFPIAADQSK